ncbi:porin family protein [uncultured Winogradskyella sp.]|uniref:porin family protein n=1 Tax=uncultured Winogradskyella sp. TaxID=395353 RepID=UPI002633779B|nr:porin family protein [uncultured Winogradskyella sp.]|tara:strand:+ start:2784 stop:3314 length:531 start_codon:yes stop_codon:yes gene_type:complete
MKKYLFLLIFVSFTSVGLSQDIFYGIRGALNVSNLDYKPDAEFSNQHRNGFAFAGFVDFEFNEKIGLRTELQWSAEGGKAQEIRADYIHLPLLLNISFTDRFSFLVGPQPSLKTWKDKDGFSTFAVSGVIGVEFMLTDELFIDARASYGLTNILDQDLTTFEAKNNVLQFGFGMKL